MDSQTPSIEEKLVPFVEGALAEADRREVLQALPKQPALNQEVRQLRETILILRTQAAKGMTYQSPVEAPVEQVVDFALQGEQWSRQSSRQFQLHLLESASMADELSILKELEQDLGQRAESSQPVPDMSAALRAAIQETYGRPPADPVWRRSVSAVVAWMAAMNMKVAGAAVGGCVLLFAAVGVGRYAHQRLESSTSTSLAVSTPAPVAGAATTPRPIPTVAEAPAGRVALLKEKVLPEDIIGLSRLLWTKHVSHSYRDGQIYVAQVDYEKAWGALQMNQSEKVAPTKPLRTGPVPEDRKTNLTDGIIGVFPDAGLPRPGKDTPPPQPRPQLNPAPSANAKKPAAPPMPALAVNLPAEPEASRGLSNADANYNVAPDNQRRPVAPAVTEPLPAAERAPRPAAAPMQQSYTPSQMARPAVASAPAPAATPSRHDAGPGQAESVRPGYSSPLQSKARQEVRRDPAAAPVHQVASGGAKVTDSVAPVVQPMQRPTQPVKVPQAAGAGLDTRHRDKEKKADFKTEEALTASVAPTPSQVALESKGMAPTPRESNSNGDEAPRPAPVAIRPESSGATSSVASAAGNISSSSPTGQGRRQASKLSTGENENFSQTRANTVPIGKVATDDGASKQQELDQSFEVQADAPFEVAMLPVAKKLVEELVGEAKVQMERKEDGHLLVTIRPARSLSAQEVDKLRKVVREKLKLKDEDTVVIRQP